MPRIEFEADTEEQLLMLARRWVMGPPQDGGTAANREAQADESELRQRQLGEALNSIRGADSRRLLREVAALSLTGAALILDADLAARYDKKSNTAFAGIVAGPNKVMRRVARRDLVTWDGDARGYRMDQADAEIVLQRWPEPHRP